TGVPFVERMADRDFIYRDVKFSKGDRIKIFLQTFAYGDPSQHHRFFGAGSHACLGRPLSMDLWAAMVEFLTASPLKVNPIEYISRPDSYVFHYPSRFEIELT